MLRFNATAAAADDDDDDDDDADDDAADDDNDDDDDADDGGDDDGDDDDDADDDDDDDDADATVHVSTPSPARRMTLRPGHGRQLQRHHVAHGGSRCRTPRKGRR